MRIHLIGIGGVGMAALAVLLRNRGHEVSGCDLAETPRTRYLRSLGIRVSCGHDRAHLEGADAAVITPAVPPACAERQAAEERNRAEPLFLRSRGEVLSELVSSAADSVAVCGSHGKTTTATFVAKLLRRLGEDVEWAIGGETGEFPVAGGRAGGVLVVEADESDGTLALYRAKTLVVTNCEYDHPDHFKTREDYLACYERAKALAADVIEGDRLAPLPPVAALGLAPHNAANARTAVEVALRRGHSPERIFAALPAVVAELPDRRFQRLAEGVYTDYAHHPTEMRCAIGMARKVCRGTLRVLFQPHRYSRTKALLADFPPAFAEADEVVLCPVYAAFEEPLEGGSSADLYAACRATEAKGGVFPAASRFRLARTVPEAWEHARLSARPGDVTLILGAGDIISLASSVAADLAAPVPPPRRIWLGAGSNTWRSDLKLNVEYVRSDSPAGRPGAALLAEHPGLMPWMAGIPGTVGGWLRMNAGAFGHSISEVVRRVKVDGRWIGRDECGFAYRTSALEGEIQDVELEEKPPAADLGTETEYRSRRLPFPPGTKGSVFRNPDGDHAGRLLESVGAKHLSVGGAFVWERHANVIVAGEGATPSDFLALARILRDRVRLRLGVILVPEVRGL